MTDDRDSHEQHIGDLPTESPTAEQAEGVRGGELVAAELDDATLTDGAIVSPRDPASGLPTGKRMHKPFTLG
ncbi:MAG TPA: hypothetical protein VKA84_08105 [Gemmatimonadaceae bacterium]|nr:hypothetical protein [Gemmatimonadaceae bacterium]